MCTMVLNETLSYYANNGGLLFCTFLDATKTHLAGLIMLNYIEWNAPNG